MLLSVAIQLFSSHGFQYLKFLARSIFVNPRLFPDAVTLAVKGYHLFKITGDMLAADSFKRYLQENLMRVEAYMREAYGAGGRVMENIAGFRARVASEAKRRYRRLNFGSRLLVGDALALFERSISAMPDEAK